MSLIPVAICHRHRWHLWLYSAGINDTGGKFATGINNTSETGGKICRRCHWYRWQICRRCRWYRWLCWWCTLTCRYLCELSTKFETVLMEYSGAGGKLIHEKYQRQKISWHCPFKLQYTKCSPDSYHSYHHITKDRLRHYSSRHMLSTCPTGGWGGSIINYRIHRMRQKTNNGKNTTPAFLLSFALHNTHNPWIRECWA